MAQMTERNCTGCGKRRPVLLMTKAMRPGARTLLATEIAYFCTMEQACQDAATDWIKEHADAGPG